MTCHRNPLLTDNNMYYIPAYWLMSDAITEVLHNIYLMSDAITEVLYNIYDTLDYWISLLEYQFETFEYEYIFNPDIGCFVLLVCAILFIYKCETSVTQQKYEQLQEVLECMRMHEDRLHEDMEIKRKCLELLSAEQHSLMAMVEYTKRLSTQLEHVLVQHSVEDQNKKWGHLQEKRPSHTSEEELNNVWMSEEDEEEEEEGNEGGNEDEN
ncbi:uncharacterized protein [Periplaneta americana]|uniref:uncharacterized protein n=1 Tax=Periplaneta americana TaxID=6978 RepID=UPI0037E8B2D6